MRILVTGASGSGTSTFAQALAAAVGFPWLDADDYYWIPTEPPFQTKRPREERRALVLGRFRDTHGAVVSGSIVDWGAELEDGFDLIVFLIVPTAIRLERLTRRETALRGGAKPEFLAWAGQYDEGHLAGRSRAIHEAWLAARRSVVLRIEGEHPVTAMIPMALRALADIAADCDPGTWLRGITSREGRGG